MHLAELVDAYDRLEATSKRLEMRAILVELFHRVTPAELPEIVYLSQGLLRPEYEGVELGVADSLAQKAVADALGLAEETVQRHTRRSGDLGTSVSELAEEHREASTGRPLGVNELYETLLSIARTGGEGSQEQKIRLLSGLLRRATAREAKYVARFVLGKLRLGVREMTILDALTEAFAGGTKESRLAVEAAFNLSSDLGVVAQRLAVHGLSGLKEIGLEVGRPVRSMLAERVRDLPELLERMGGRAALEYKYDGLRVQAHVPKHGPVRLFSRRLEEISRQFPELVADLPSVIREPPAIVEGECVPIDPNTEEILPFQEVSRRRGRKYEIERMQAEVPVRLFLFDILMDSGEAVLAEDFPRRRDRLEKGVKESERVRLATQKLVASVEEAQDFFDRSIADGCEGILAKSVAPGSSYRAGARGFWWIKYKRDYTQALADSIDGVVVGAFYGRGRRGGRYGALLCAAYNPEEDRFETFCKVGSGFDDATLAGLPQRLKEYEVETPPDDVLTGLVPDQWMRPGLVLEIRGAELSLSPNHRAAVGKLRPNAGLALRFPRFTGRFRDDKKASEATTTEELVEMYELQVKQSKPRAEAASATDGA